ncbi:MULTISPECIES: hypothetical protein [unclassified Rhodococcus (in: high G+C Gram-positive bacteria)]|uniref:hypothetical protein n=1 Tax=unclassified Rhodococcus (in: high G+C Gram-positive bacteria) TaxID=192944 RepID=UPI00163A12A6|nr:MULTISPECIES: hypothetical protein [unclassified Rhodococcus (in: high G+C Gram-positive bacteria)]MBC2644228.1 hypothetical protein [Rhodococcus sp. 3A]MBC2891033.1 hypothetical protein [Rhodococcus sp. 4CII]
MVDAADQVGGLARERMKRAVPQPDTAAGVADRFETEAGEGALGCIEGGFTTLRTGALQGSLDSAEVAATVGSHLHRPTPLALRVGVGEDDAQQDLGEHIGAAGWDTDPDIGAGRLVHFGLRPTACR